MPQDTKDARVRQHENSAANVRGALVTSANTLTQLAADAARTASDMQRDAINLPMGQAEMVIRGALDAQNAAELLRKTAGRLADAIGAAAAEEAIRRGAGVRPIGRGRYGAGIEL